jgi:hypothetical protein
MKGNLTMKAAMMIALFGAVAVAVAGEEVPPIPSMPAAVDGLVYARSFSLTEGFMFDLRKERPEVKEGLLLVLKADEALLVPRAALMPVLYVGDQTAERLNMGDKSGHVIAIVPGKPDLTKAPIWFGTPRFPEKIDHAVIKAEREMAEEAGIRPLPADQVKAALALGGDPIKATNLREVLRREAAELILKYSPQEKHIAEGFRVPEVRRKAKTDDD